jgi:hypothetical protein
MSVTMKGVFAVMALVIWFAGDAAATTWRWTDERGVVHFSDNYDNIPSRYREKVRVESESTPSVIPRGEVAAQPPHESAPSAEPGKSRSADGHKPKKRHHRKHHVKSPEITVTPARRAQDQAEEQIRNDRQAIEDAQLPARKAQERAEEQIRRSGEGTMGH